MTNRLDFSADQIKDFGQATAALLLAKGGAAWKESIENLFQEWLISFESDVSRRDEVLADHLFLMRFFDDLSIIEEDHD